MLRRAPALVVPPLVPVLPVLAACAALVGCGGSADAGAFTSDTGGALADSSTAGDDGTDAAPDGSVDTGVPTDGATDLGADLGSDLGSDTPPPPPVTLDTVCDKLADAVCAAPLATCCTKSGFGYDGPGCRDAIKASCGDWVADVKDGTKTFDASAFPGCAAAWGKLETACSVHVLEFLRTYPPCRHLFDGDTAPGDGCDVDEDCKSPPGGFGACTDGSCVQYTVVGKDAPCNISGDVQSVCDLGLFCNVTGGGADPKGTCKTARKLGESCTFSRWFECGPGYVCAGGAGGSKCAEGKPGGATCAGGYECASWTCTAGRCTSPSHLVASRAICGG